MKDIIGFWGYPHPNLIEKAKKEYEGATFVDLDIDFGYPKSKFTPNAYCGIIKNIFNNAFFLKENLIKILAPIGKDKCDAGFFVANILKNEGFEVEMCKFEEISPIENLQNVPICQSNLPLREKIEKITENIILNKDYNHLSKTKPRFGFWGVPPNDLTILELFPNNTEVFGWCRCVEAKNPANIELEMYVNENLPTVFFAQTFCAKNALAKYLAQKYNGLYIDIDGLASNSVKAKIEAFLRLR